MAVSVFDLFKIGIGPSSSHTVGPMRAAGLFVRALADGGRIDAVRRIKVELFGSLGATGRGHGSDRAVLLGLEGETPDQVDPDGVEARLAQIRERGELRLPGDRRLSINLARDLVLHQRRSLPLHPNGMRFCATDAAQEIVHEAVYYSVGGGFVVDESAGREGLLREDDTVQPHPFRSAAT